MDPHCQCSGKSATAVRQRVVDCVAVCVRNFELGVPSRPQQPAFAPFVPQPLFFVPLLPGAACVPVPPVLPRRRPVLAVVHAGD